MQKKNLKTMVECAVMIALAVVLSMYTKIWEAPLGGSVTLFSMVPIIIISLRHGVLWGYACAFVYSATYWLFYGIGQIIGISTYVFIMSSVVDYIIAYTLIGTAGFFKVFVDKYETKSKKILFASVAVVSACFLRFAAHIVVGATVWYELTKGWYPITEDPETGEQIIHYVHNAGMWVYSIVYNLQYMIPETIITLVAVPAIITILAAVKSAGRKNA